jgi:hypothetical protein
MVTDDFSSLSFCDYICVYLSSHLHLPVLAEGQGVQAQVAVDLIRIK